MLQAILDKIVEVQDDVKRVDEKVVKNGKRIDKLGEQLAYLEDDAPTKGEFEKLEKRVGKLEKVIVS